MIIRINNKLFAIKILKRIIIGIVILKKSFFYLKFLIENLKNFPFVSTLFLTHLFRFLIWLSHFCDQKVSKMYCIYFLFKNVASFFFLWQARPHQTIKLFNHASSNNNKIFCWSLRFLLLLFGGFSLTVSIS